MLVLVLSALVGYVIADDEIGILQAGDLVINQSSMSAVPSVISLGNGPASSILDVTDVTGEAAPPDNYTWVINGLDEKNQSTSQLSRTFSTPGIYPVALIAENRTWLTVLGHTQAYDYKSIPGGVTATVPIEGFFNNSTTGVPFEIYFNFTSNNTRWRGIPTNWTWDFYNSTGKINTTNNTYPNFTYTFPIIPVNRTYTVSCRAYNTTGFVVDNYSTKDVEVKTVPLVVANFTATPETCPAFPVDVQFRDNSTSGSFLAITDQLWDFGDNTNSTNQNPTHSYHRPGTYRVNYTAINRPYGYQNSTQMDLIISGLFANFTYEMDPSSGNFTPGGVRGVRVNFTSTTTGSPTYFDWDFGDNIPPDSQTNLWYANHTYTKKGTYNVTLTAYGVCADGSQISNSTVRSLTFRENLVANYTYSPNSGKYPLKVQFMDSSYGSPVRWEWWFYDQNGNQMSYSKLQNPNNTYNGPGTYRVDLSITDRDGKTAEKFNEYITLYEGVNAGFSADKTKGTFPLLVTFTDSSTPVGQVSNWNWTFGDGADVVRTQSANHTYTRKGNFTVSLTAGNSQTSDTETKGGYISIGTRITPAFTPIGQVPVRAPFIVNFTDASTPADEVSGWQWSFSDGGSANGRTVSHQFPATGLYNVTLNVSSYWDARTTTGQVNITEINEPVADFVFSPLTVNAGETVRFEDRSYGPGPLNWSWQFGDGGFASTQSPEYVYQYAGRYYPVLTVINPYGSNTKNSTIPVSVRGQVIPSFITDKPDWWAVINQPVRFIDTSKGQPVSWVWDFADGTAPVTTADPEIVHIYTRAGIYNVTMTGTNWNGDTRTAFHSFEVTDKDIPRDVGFNTTGMKYSGAHPLTVQFQDQTPAQSNVIEWYWDFGDRTNAFFTTPTAPTHTYTIPGEYTVTLTVRNDMGVNEKIRVAFVVVV